MNRKLITWEVSSFFFIGLVGAALHFTFELSNFSSMVVAYFSAVNESTWEHLKMAFFPGIFFALVEYTYVRDVARNYLIAKTASVFIMPLIITLGWYAYTPFTGRSIYRIDLILFYIAVLVGHIVSYKILTTRQLPKSVNRIAQLSMVLLFAAFSTFTFLPPRIFLFEHFDLKDTGLYGILDNYDGLRYFTKPPAK